jgi:hypothetical protein
MAKRKPRAKPKPIPPLHDVSGYYGGAMFDY